MCFQSALNKTLCLTPPPPTRQHFKHYTLQNYLPSYKPLPLSASYKIKLSISASPLPIGFQQNVLNIKIEKTTSTSHSGKQTPTTALPLCLANHYTTVPLRFT